MFELLILLLAVGAGAAVVNGNRKRKLPRWRIMPRGEANRRMDYIGIDDAPDVRPDEAFPGRVTAFQSAWNHLRKGTSEAQWTLEHWGYSGEGVYLLLGWLSNYDLPLLNESGTLDGPTRAALRSVTKDD